MTLQPPQPLVAKKQYNKIYCYKCGAEITFRKDQVGLQGKKIPLDVFFNNEPHAQHCMYEELVFGASPDLEPLLFDFLSLIPRTHPKKRKVLFAVGQAK